MTETTQQAPEPPEAKFGTTEAGVPIVAMKAIVNKTGDGLSDAISVQNIRIAPKAEAHIGMRVVHEKDRFDYTEQRGFVVATLVQIFAAVESAFVDPESIEPMLVETAAKVQVAKGELNPDQGAFTFDDKAEEATCRHCGGNIFREDEDLPWLHLDSTEALCTLDVREGEVSPTAEPVEELVGA